MRVTPIAVAFAHAPEARRAATLADARITHFDPRCQLASVAFTAAIAAGLTTPGDTLTRRAAMTDAARAELEQVAEQLAAALTGLSHEVEQAMDALRQDLRVASEDDSRLYGEDGFDLVGAAGFVRVAFRLAFWHLHHAADFRSSMVDIANRGGDADTNCAIAGGLLGALFGLLDIPDAWLERTLQALQDQPPSPLRDRLHPKTLLRLVSAS